MRSFFSALSGGLWRGNGEKTEFDDSGSPRSESITVEMACDKDNDNKWSCGSHTFFDEMVADSVWIFEIRGDELYDVAPDADVHLRVQRTTPTNLVFEESWSASEEDDSRYVQTTSIFLLSNAKLRMTLIVRLGDKVVARTEFELTR